MQPHGLNVVLKEEILENGKVISSFENKSVFEAWIGITNQKTNKYIELPMRSFVNGFIDKLRALLAGTVNTYRSSVSCASVGASTYDRQGMILGTGISPVVISDTAMETIASNALLGYGITTFQGTTATAVNSHIVIQSEVRRIFQNNSTGTYYISEVGLFGRTASNASGASVAHNTMYSRDLIHEFSTGGSSEIGRSPIPFLADTDMRVDFKFKINAPVSTGGLLTNFMKLVYNLFFKANPMADPKIINTNGANTTYTYAANFPLTAGAASAAFCNIAGGATEFKGIFVGKEHEVVQSFNGENYNLGDWPGSYTADEYTCTATTVSAVSGGKFTVTRTFTNAGAASKSINRIGIMGRGNTGGLMTAVPTAGGEFLMALNIPATGAVTLQPSQTYRITYIFSI